jgi:N-methylhydantoinase B
LRDSIELAGDELVITIKNGLDPITFELIRNSLSTIIDEMALAMNRTAYSPLIRDLFDFATGMCDVNGEIIAEGLVNPIHSGVFPIFVKALVKNWAGRIYPGDVFICNDPYEGASHIPDVYTVRPVFVDGELVAFAGSIAHQLDFGGKTPGSNACDNTSIYQEGLRIPPLKYYERGERNFSIYRLIEKNARISDKVLGDMESQVAATALGERELIKLITKYGGWKVFHSYVEELLNYSERLTRAAIKTLPEGEYDFEDWMDDDGFSTNPVRFYLKIIVKGDSIVFDYTGSSPTVKGSINLPLSSTVATVNTAMRFLLDPSIPPNSGVFRARTIIAPYGTILNVGFPAGVAGRGATVGRLWDVTIGAMAKILPDKVPACWTSVDFGICMGGANRDGSLFVLTDFLPGSWPGRPFADGIDAHTPPWVNYSNVPCEVIEREYPLSFQQYQFVADTGGAGKYRGGVSIIKDYRIESPDKVEVQWRQDRTLFRAWGLKGGGPGAPSEGYQITPDGKKRALKKECFYASPGDVLRAVVPAAGGWGNPLERDPEKVLQDVRNELVSVDAAKRDYGVVIHPKLLEIDRPATDKLRASAGAK